MTDLAKVIDYTLLRPAITADEIKGFCRRARLDVYSLEKWLNQIAHHTPNIEITIQKILQLITGCTTLLIRLK